MSTTKHEIAETKFMPVNTAPASDDVSQGEVIDIGKGRTVKLDPELSQLLESYVPETELEKKVRKKADMFLIPMLWIMCILCFIDRSNVGNANAAGMSDDLSMSPNQYAFGVSIFFIAYCVWEVPSNLILARVRPSIYLPSLTVVWGCIVVGLGFVDNYSHFLVCRFFLGIIEAGFPPGVLYIFTCWYKKNEVGKRWCLFYSAICVSGAASGLIAGAVISGLEGHSGRAGWRWLFIIEGCVTIGVGILASIVLLDYPTSNTRRFTKEEREMAIVRIMHDRADASGNKKKLTPFESLKAAILDTRVYLFILMFMMQNASSTISYFVPTVVGSLGYSGTMKQWMTVPIWAVGIVFLLVIPTLSDRTGNRQWFIVACLFTGLLSSIICVASHNNVVRYVFLCFYIGGLYTTLPLILAWASEMLGQPAEKRAVIVAFVNCSGSISSIYGTYLWPSTDAPKYTKGFVAVSTFLGIAVIVACFFPALARFMPRRQTRAMREIEAEE